MKRPHILTRITNAARRAASLWLCLAVLFGVSLTLTQTAKAASWMDPYLNQMKEWGVMKGDANGNLHGERAITRAEFVVMLNRGTSHLFTEGRIHTHLLQRALSQSQAEKTLQCEGTERELMLIYSCLMVGFLVKWASAASDSDFDWHSLLSREMRLMFVRPPEITDIFNAP